MTVLRANGRKTLQWCLDQEERFTAMDCGKAMEIHQTSVSKQFARFEALGLLKRERAGYYVHYWTIDNREKAQALADEEPGPANGYIPVARRPKGAQAKVINSVFALGGL